MPKEIPLITSNPHQNFSVTLGSYTLKFEFSWITRFGYFRVNVFEQSDNNRVIALGQAARSGVDILSRFEKYGRVYIAGSEPTLENIGVNSKLMWEAPDA